MKPGLSAWQDSNDHPKQTAAVRQAHGVHSGHLLLMGLAGQSGRQYRNMADAKPAQMRIIPRKEDAESQKAGTKMQRTVSGGEE